MRVLLIAVGTRGDVQPALALALELHQLGHSTRLCVSPNFVGWARDLGLEALPLGVEMRAPPRIGSMPTPTAEELRRLRESMPDLITDQFETIGAAVHDCDVIVGANAHQYAAPSIAQRAGIGCVTAVYAPVALPSSELAPPPPPGQSEATVASLSIEQRWRNTARAWNERALERINHNRGRLSLAPIDDVLGYVLTDSPWLAADVALGPAPVSPGREIFQTGAWVLPDSRSLPADVEAFLGGADPPIYMGLGSMPVAGEASRTLITAARASGRRVILSKGWAELQSIDSDSDCLAVDDVSHELLFPRVAAIVHHGGAGTTAAAARAGVAQVITPMFSDQFYWARRAVELGIGTALPFGSLTQSALATAIRQVLDPAVRQRAQTFAASIDRNGAQRAARRLQAHYGR